MAETGAPMDIAEYENARRKHGFWDSEEAKKAMDFALELLGEEIDGLGPEAEAIRRKADQMKSRLADMSEESARRQKVRSLIRSDKYWEREQAVEFANNYELDQLSRDEHFEVRIAVAERGYALDRLVNDECADVRAAVAAQGFGIDRLWCDPDPYVRVTLAANGYCLDTLIGDDDPLVRKAASRVLSEQAEAMKLYPDERDPEAARQRHIEDESKMNALWAKCGLAIIDSLDDLIKHGDQRQSPSERAASAKEEAAARSHHGTPGNVQRQRIA